MRQKHIPSLEIEEGDEKDERGVLRRSWRKWTRRRKRKRKKMTIYTKKKTGLIEILKCIYLCLAIDSYSLANRKCSRNAPGVSTCPSLARARLYVSPCPRR